MAAPEQWVTGGRPASQLARLGWILALTGLIVGIGTAAARPQELAFAGLTACLFFLSLGLGALFFVLIQLVSRAGWSVVPRRLAEQVMATLPVASALLLILLVWGLGHLYPWAPAAADERRLYLSPGFFLLRSGAYLGLWSLLAWWLRRQSLRQDLAGEVAISRRLQAVSGPALVIFGLTLTFAAFDWVMSLEPEWYSTIFGVYLFSGAAMAIHALLALLAVWLLRQGLLSHVIGEEHLHDLGKLLFAFMVFWAYIAFSQFLLVWYANLPEETVWYARRLSPGWRGATRFLALGHFVLPFFFLLPRRIKRARRTLALAAVWLLAMHYLDLYWLVMPALDGRSSRPTWSDLSAVLTVGGIFLGSLGWILGRSSLVPAGDPRLEESFSVQNT